MIVNLACEQTPDQRKGKRREDSVLVSFITLSTVCTIVYTEYAAMQRISSNGGRGRGGGGGGIVNL